MTVAVLGWFLDPLTDYGFMRVGLLAAMVVGLVCSLLSCFLVVRQEALLGDAISHALLPGVAIGYLVAGEAGLFVGALVAAISTGLVITFIERNSPVKPDAAMGIGYTAAFALGLAIISVAQPRGIDLFHVLFGNILALQRSDVLVTVGVGCVAVTTMAVLYRWLHIWSFDAVLAETLGVPVRPLSYAFTVMLSGAIVSSMKAVGLLLVVALLIVPGATAQLLTSRLPTMMAVAAGVGLLSGITGLYVSFYVDVASGPAIVLTATLCFALAMVFSPHHGLLPRRRTGPAATTDETLPDRSAAR